MWIFIRRGITSLLKDRFPLEKDSDVRADIVKHCLITNGNITIARNAWFEERAELQKHRINGVTIPTPELHDRDRLICVCCCDTKRTINARRFRILIGIFLKVGNSIPIQILRKIIQKTLIIRSGSSSRISCIQCCLLNMLGRLQAKRNVRYVLKTIRGSKFIEP